MAVLNETSSPAKKNLDYAFPPFALGLPSVYERAGFSVRPPGSRSRSGSRSSSKPASLNGSRADLVYGSRKGSMTSSHGSIPYRSKRSSSRPTSMDSANLIFGKPLQSGGEHNNSSVRSLASAHGSSHAPAPDVHNPPALPDSPAIEVSAPPAAIGSVESLSINRHHHDDQVPNQVPNQVPEQPEEEEAAEAERQFSQRAAVENEVMGERPLGVHSKFEDDFDDEKEEDDYDANLESRIDALDIKSGRSLHRSSDDELQQSQHEQQQPPQQPQQSQHHLFEHPEPRRSGGLTDDEWYEDAPQSTPRASAHMNGYVDEGLHTDEYARNSVGVHDRADEDDEFRMDDTSTESHHVAYEEPPQEPYEGESYQEEPQEPHHEEPREEFHGEAGQAELTTGTQEPPSGIISDDGSHYEEDNAPGPILNQREIETGPADQQEQQPQPPQHSELVPGPPPHQMMPHQMMPPQNAQPGIPSHLTPPQGPMRPGAPVPPHLKGMAPGAPVPPHLRGPVPGGLVPPHLRGVPPQGFPGMPPQGMPPHGVPPPHLRGVPQGFPPQGLPPQGLPPQGFPPQGFPPQGFPPQGFPPQGFPPQHMGAPMSPMSPGSRQGMPQVKQSAGMDNSDCFMSARTRFPKKNGISPRLNQGEFPSPSAMAEIPGVPQKGRAGPPPNIMMPMGPGMGPGPNMSPTMGPGMSPTMGPGMGGPGFRGPGPRPPMGYPAGYPMSPMSPGPRGVPTHYNNAVRPQGPPGPYSPHQQGPPGPPGPGGPVGPAGPHQQGLPPSMMAAQAPHDGSLPHPPQQPHTDSPTSSGDLHQGFSDESRKASVSSTVTSEYDDESRNDKTAETTPMATSRSLPEPGPVKSNGLLGVHDHRMSNTSSVYSFAQNDTASVRPEIQAQQPVQPPQSLQPREAGATSGTQEEDLSHNHGPSEDSSISFDFNHGALATTAPARKSTMLFDNDEPEDEDNNTTHFEDDETTPTVQQTGFESVEPSMITTAEGKKKGKTPKVCRGCMLPITGKSIRALDGSLTGRWHRECFNCTRCGISLAGVDKIHVLNDQPFCGRCYHIVNNSVCRLCGEGIEGPCLETRLSEDGGQPFLYHIDCLKCAECGIKLQHSYFDVGGATYCAEHAFTSLPDVNAVHKRYTQFMMI